MTGPTILILTTVHRPDDTRIREKLARSLDGLGTIFYACQEPGPSDRSGITWLPLNGGRVRRNLSALRILWGGWWDLVILHDPETIPAGVLARRFRRATVVFDVHEDLPGQISSKEWIPAWAEPFFRLLARGLYRMADRRLVLTLAEPGYQRLFSSTRPVFQNFPKSEDLPDPRSSGDGTAIYVGDVTRARGIEEALAACGAADVHLVVVGRVSDGLAGSLRGDATRRGFGLTITGPLAPCRGDGPGLCRLGGAFAPSGRGQLPGLPPDQDARVLGVRCAGRCYRSTRVPARSWKLSRPSGWCRLEMSRPWLLRSRRRCRSPARPPQCARRPWCVRSFDGPSRRSGLSTRVCSAGEKPNTPAEVHGG